METNECNSVHPFLGYGRLNLTLPNGQTYQKSFGKWRRKHYTAISGMQLWNTSQAEEAALCEANNPLSEHCLMR
jgi:hypothetical protein